MKVTITFDKLNVKNKFKKINVDNKIEKVLVKMIAATGPQGPTGPQGEQGPQGPAGAVKIIAVTELPATGETGTIYLVPNEDTETENNYIEYIYINGAWEKFGETQVGVDLTDYVKNTDYATSSKGGVTKTGNHFLVNATTGVPYSSNIAYENYGVQANTIFISKGTLENVITGKALETANNKVTELTSSSTDTQYPSAKATYDELKKQKDTLENLMPKKEVEGETISVTDATEYPLLKFDGDGKSVQDGEPTPDNPVEISSITGDIELNRYGKNLLDRNLFTRGKQFDENTFELTDNNYCWYTEDYQDASLYADENRQFTMSGVISLVCCEYDENYNFIKGTTSRGQSKVTVTLDSTTKYVRFSFYIYNQADIIQIEKGTTATTKVPFTKETLTIPLGTNELCSIPNTTIKDNLVFDLNNGEIKKIGNIGEVVLDGTQTISSYNTSSTNTTRVSYHNLVTNALSTITLLCNMLPQRNNWNSDSEGVSLHSANRDIWFRIKKSTIGTTQAETNSFLATNNMIVYYALATSTETLITTLSQEDLAKLKFSEGENTIQAITNLGNMNIRVKYIRSLNIILASLENV